MTIPDDGQKYHWKHYNRDPSVDNPAIASRFLTQATFGPTRQLLQSPFATSRLDTSDFRAWIDDQMQVVPPSLHRVYYRSRVNPRATRPFPSGGVRSPCRAGARYHRYTLTKADEGSTLEVAQAPSTQGYTMHVNGKIRGWLATFTLSPGVGTYTICWVEERIDGTIAVRQGANANCRRPLENNDLLLSNPPIEFDHSAMPALTSTHRHSGDAAAVLTPLSPSPNASLLEGDLICSSHYAARSYGYLKIGSGVYWRHDPRLSLLQNTIDQPANSSNIRGDVSGASPALVLPRVPKTFLNKHTCKPLSLSSGASAETSSSIAYGSARFHLNETILSSMYTHGGRYVYYLTGLRLEGAYAASPCQGVSRWKRDTSSGACTSEIVPDAATRSAMVSAITSSGDMNEYVIDVEVGQAAAAGGGSCSDAVNGVSAIGARVSIGTTCWQHVHPSEYNVYDFTEWAHVHPGGSYRITSCPTCSTNGGVAIHLATSIICSLRALETRRTACLQTSQQSMPMITQLSRQGTTRVWSMLIMRGGRVECMRTCGKVRTLYGR